MAREITHNNFEISLVVFMPNITTNHAITYTNTDTPLIRTLSMAPSVFNGVWLHVNMNMSNFVSGNLCSSSRYDSVFHYGGFLLDADRGNLPLHVCC